MSSSFGLALSDYGPDSSPLSESNLAAISESLSNSFNPTSSPVPSTQTNQASPGSAFADAQSSPFTVGDINVPSQSFHAEFITHPIVGPAYPSGGGVSPPLAPVTPTSDSPGHSPSPAGGRRDPLSSPSHTLPSFLDTYTPTGITTIIQQRPFGAESEYEKRQQQRSQQQQQQ